MICKSCGAENSNRAKFCGKCGRNLQSGEKNTYSNKEKKKRKNPLGMILVIILCTFLLSAGLFVIVQRKQIKENPYNFNPIEEKITAAFDELPPHTRDFRRELGGFTCTIKVRMV